MSLQHMTGEETIETLRRIVSTHSYMKLNRGRRSPVLVDVITANAVLTVYDALNDENKAKYSKLTIDRMVDIAWKILSKGGK